MATVGALAVAACGGPQHAPHRLAATSRPMQTVESPGPILRPTPPTPHRRQYVVISFDGSGTYADVRSWRLLGQETGAKFTFFVSGVYLLPGEDSAEYVAPHHTPGESAIPYISREHERLLLPELQAAYDDGNEIGTHFNGHFCAPLPWAVGTWSAADWASELDQFDTFLSTAARRTGVRRQFRLTANDIVGERTPCLEGNLTALRSVLRARHFRYDASGTALLGAWPERVGGLWEFPLQVIKVAERNTSWLSMDYNFFLNLTGGAMHVPAGEPAVLRRIERLSYERALTQLMHTTHAPLFIGAHFESWDRNAYTDGLVDFVRDECTRPAVACVTFAHLADVLDARRDR